MYLVKYKEGKKWVSRESSSQTVFSELEDFPKNYMQI